MPPNRPRNSHYLPKFYLSGFTRTGTPDGELIVVDLTTGKEWFSTPAKTAREKDLYVVDLGPTEDPDLIEKAMAKLEGEFSRVVRSIAEEEKLPERDDFVWFLNFVALQVTRLPRTRKILAGVIDRSSKAELREVFSTPDGWARFKRVLVEQGHPVRDGEYEEFRRLAFSDNFMVDFDQTTHIQMMARRMIDSLLPVLSERCWSLGILAPDAPDLLCSDAPVSVWPDAGADGTKPPTIESRNTVLSFPITRRLIAIGRYEQRRPILVVTPPGAAMFNTWTCCGARQVISGTSDFILMGPNRELAGKVDLLRFTNRSGAKQ